MDSAVESTTLEQLRASLAARLREGNWIRTSAVHTAFCTVPRHLFVPETVTLAEAYADTIVATKRGPDGKTMSSVSAPWLSLSTPVVLRSGGHRLDSSLACSTASKSALDSPQGERLLRRTRPDEEA